MFLTPSKSCESLLRSGKQKQARLPIANGTNTKRLVDRGCVDDSNYVQFGNTNNNNTNHEGEVEIVVENDTTDGNCDIGVGGVGGGCDESNSNG